MSCKKKKGACEYLVESPLPRESVYIRKFIQGSVLRLACLLGRPMTSRYQGTLSRWRGRGSLGFSATKDHRGNNCLIRGHFIRRRRFQAEFQFRGTVPLASSGVRTTSPLALQARGAVWQRREV